MLLAAERRDALGEGRGSEWAAGDDAGSARDLGHFATNDFDARVTGDGAGYAVGEGFTIYGQGTAGGQGAILSDAQ